MVRLLNQHEIQTVSGGFFSLSGGITAGMNGFNLMNTILNAANSYSAAMGVFGVFAGLAISLNTETPSFVVVTVVTAVCTICGVGLGFGWGAAEGYIGYKMGSYFPYETKKA